MRIEVVHIGGRYPERVIAHLKEMSPGNVDDYQVPGALPPILDDAADLLPGELGAGEVIVAIDIHPELLLEIPEMVESGSVRALIAPIENPNWVKPGLQRQVTQACAKNNMESAFPKPFCALEPTTPAITEFCEQFQVGVPNFRFELADGKVVAVELLRGSPCGLTDFVARELVGMEASDSLPEKASQLHHSYPCLASMAMDPATNDTIMHKSVDMIRERVKEALEEARGQAG